MHVSFTAIKGIKRMFTTETLFPNEAFRLKALKTVRLGQREEGRYGEGLCNAKTVAFGIFFASALARVRPRPTVPKLCLAATSAMSFLRFLCRHLLPGKQCFRVAHSCELPRRYQAAWFRPLTFPCPLPLFPIRVGFDRAGCGLGSEESGAFLRRAEKIEGVAAETSAAVFAAEASRSLGER